MQWHLKHWRTYIVQCTAQGLPLAELYAEALALSMRSAARPSHLSLHDHLIPDFLLPHEHEVDRTFQ
jgi:hypothetical protein